MTGGRYQSSGYPRCRFVDKQQIILLNYILSQSGAFALGDNEIAILRRPLMATNGVFRHSLKFFVNSLDKEFAISLTGINMKSRVISGFPTTTSLMRNQGLDNHFGRTSRQVRRLETTTQTPQKDEGLRQKWLWKCRHSARSRVLADVCGCLAEPLNVC